MIGLVAVGGLVQIYQVYRVTDLATANHETNARLVILTERFCEEVNNNRQITNHDIRVPERTTNIALATFLRKIAFHETNKVLHNQEVVLASDLEKSALAIKLISPYSCDF